MDEYNKHSCKSGTGQCWYPAQWDVSWDQIQLAASAISYHRASLGYFEKRRTGKGKVWGGDPGTCMRWLGDLKGWHLLLNKPDSTSTKTWMMFGNRTRNGALREYINEMMVLFIWLHKLSHLKIPVLGCDHTNLAFVRHEVSMFLPGPGYMESF